MKVRKPVVSGMFYDSTAKELLKQIEWCYKHELGPGVTPKINIKGRREIVASLFLMPAMFTPDQWRLMPIRNWLMMESPIQW